MILGRLGQGFAGGVLIPTAMTLVSKRLPPSQQAGGLAMVAVSALMGPAIGPVLGGWLTENYSWHFAFFINVPICAAQVAMLLVALPKLPGNWHELREADWAGVAGMVIGLGALTTLLEEGHREQWFESALIWKLALASGLGFGMIGWGQWRAARPVIRLALLRNRELTSAILVMIAIGTLLYSSIYVIPQFLAAIAGYNALQAGQVTFIDGFVAIPAAALYPAIVGRIDTRMIIALGLCASVAGCAMAGRLTALSTGDAFTWPQVLYGVGTTLCALPLQQVVVATATLDETSEVNSLFSVARNLGGTVGLAGLASFQDQRFDVHAGQLRAAIPANDSAVQGALAQGGAMFGGGADGMAAALQVFDGQVLQQALVMTFNDMFLALGAVALVVMPLVLFLRPLKPGTALVMH